MQGARALTCATKSLPLRLLPSSLPTDSRPRNTRPGPVPAHSLSSPAAASRKYSPTCIPSLNPRNSSFQHLPPSLSFFPSKYPTISSPPGHVQRNSVSQRHTVMASTPTATITAATTGPSTSELARDPSSLPLAPFPPNPKFTVALCQLAVTSDKTRNISHAKAVIEKAADDGAKLILLPEMWNCPYSNDSFPLFAEEIEAPHFSSSPSAQMLSSVAASKGITIVGGSIPERKDGKLFNTSLVFGTDGVLKGNFSKLHLFDIDIPGKMTFKESLTLTPGENLLVVDTEVGRIGVAICYDIRFPELFMLYASRGVHMILIPGAFNMTTGPLHWELLQRARAADNQVFLATCSPARDDSASYRAWGHSTLVGPFGEVLATTEHEEATVMGEIDLTEIPLRRQALPFTTQKRGDLYTLVDKTRSSGLI